MTTTTAWIIRRPSVVRTFVPLLLGLISSLVMAQGRLATPAEIKAWNIDVRPDFLGLPKGQGTVSQGENVWEGKCASCHGSFGESNQVFAPMIGYTTVEDGRKGHVASLQINSVAPTRTTLMKVSQISTLWDYINRAMPWTAPKSLSVNEVYAVTAYILNMAKVLPDDATLSDTNIRDAQNKLPNRSGMTQDHALWPGTKKKPDVQGSSCVKNCGNFKVVSTIPDYAQNAHGNLAEQVRLVGAVRGIETLPTDANTAENNSNQSPQSQAPSTRGTFAPPSATLLEVMKKNNCTACHGMDTKLVGPAFKEIASKYQGRVDGVAYLTGKIRSGGQGTWGAIPMPAQTLPEADAQAVAKWLLP